MTRQKRWMYAAIFAVLFLAEIAIALWVHDEFVRPYVGDILVTILLAALVRIVFPKGIRLLPLYVFLVATAVEFGQYFHVLRWLGLAENAFFRTLLGTSFSVWDIVCYAVGCLLFLAVEYAVNIGARQKG